MGGTRVGDGAVEQQQQQERHLLVGRERDDRRCYVLVEQLSRAVPNNLPPTPSARLAFRTKKLMLAGFRRGV